MNPYNERTVMVSNEIIIPDNKIDFIVRMGIKAFAEDCFLPCAHPGEVFEDWAERAIKYADLPDDWTRDQYRKMVTPLMPELFDEAVRRDREMREVIASWKEEDDAE